MDESHEQKGQRLARSEQVGPQAVWLSRKWERGPGEGAGKGTRAQSWWDYNASHSLSCQFFTNSILSRPITIQRYEMVTSRPVCRVCSQIWLDPKCLLVFGKSSLPC